MSARTTLPTIVGIGLTLAMVFLSKGFSMGATDSGSLLNIVSGNTLVVMRGAVSTFIRFEATGKAIAETPRSLAIAEGEWWIDGEQVCMRQTAPLQAGSTAEAQCLIVLVRSFDKVWQIDDPRAGTIGYKWLRGNTTHFPSDATH